MKFSEEKRSSIKQYILEKIEQGTDSLSKIVSIECGINQNTVHTYINELVDDNIIKREKRGKYELISDDYFFHLTRNDGDLNNESHIFDKCLREHIIDLPPNVFEIWNYVFSEMMNNAIDHSEAKNVFVLVKKSYLKTMVAIKDDGVGIFNKIKEHFSLNSLDEAITELFKGKLTTDKSRHSGEGIFFSSRMMDLFIIWSSGKRFSINKYENSSLVDLVNQKFGESGTMVIMELNNFSHRTTLNVFDEYSNDDNKFVKTVIPLNNIFETAPVSRSQAKRICHRLNTFKEITLDFDGLEWMGQGFAHQIFVVFKNAHPDIEIIPVNMSEGVNKMYQHVLESI